MNVFQALLAGKQKGSVEREHLPELNAFVDVCGGGKTEFLPIEALGRADFDVRRPLHAAVGTKALFNYSNGRGRFRFYAECTAIDGKTAKYALPQTIKVIEKFGDKRSSYRLKCALTVSWRYAPDGVGHGEFLAGTTSDISATGGSLVVPRALESGTQLEIAFDFKRAGRVALIGTLTRPSQKKPSGKFIAGVVFRKISQAHASAIRDFIASRQDGQRKRSIADNE